MKTTIVPAQVLTIEDRIGNLSLTQICLLVVALIVDGAIGECMAPAMRLSSVKLLCMTFCSGIIGGLAFRMQETLLLNWVLLLLDYCFRARYFVYRHGVRSSAMNAVKDASNVEKLASDSKSLEASAVLRLHAETINSQGLYLRKKRRKTYVGFTQAEKIRQR